MNSPLQVFKPFFNDPEVVLQRLTPPDPSVGLGGANAAVAVGGLGGAAVMDPPRGGPGGGDTLTRY